MNPRLFDVYDRPDHLHFRQRNMLGHGTLKMVDDTGPVQDHQFEGYPTELRYAGHYGAHGLFSVPLAGATLVTLHQGGYRGFNSIAAVVDGRYRPTGHQPGEGGVYMVDGAASDGTGGTTKKIIEGLLGGIINVGDAGAITINLGSAAASVTLNMGDSGATVNIEGGSGDVKVNNVSLVNHVHSDAGGSGDSGPPVSGT